ncbi:hypothetical protein LCGC14_2112530 [marine sediment metagenome]|uniref:Uncharacterized protein n=1 Tax=marine sediment metagenome TaxID=412755 RepID=A0A0F9E6Q7_9ZZZZ
MKTEHEIAKDNIKHWKFTKPQDKELWRLNIYRSKCIQHKETCQRFLDFLEEKGFTQNMGSFSTAKVSVKITDLYNTIKLYNDDGI